MSISEILKNTICENKSLSQEVISQFQANNCINKNNFNIRDCSEEGILNYMQNAISNFNQSTMTILTAKLAKANQLATTSFCQKVPQKDQQTISQNFIWITLLNLVFEPSIDLEQIKKQYYATIFNTDSINSL